MFCVSSSEANTKIFPCTERFRHFEFSVDVNKFSVHFEAELKIFAENNGLIYQKFRIFFHVNDVLFT